MNIAGIANAKDKKVYYHEPSAEDSQIKTVLAKFQDGYKKRNVNEVAEFVETLFIKDENKYVLGTGTEELFIGTDQIKELFLGDWEYWGDMSIDLQNVHVISNDKTAWFATTGTVSYQFENSTKNLDRHFQVIKDIAKNTKLSPKQRVAFINWLLSLFYHQREGSHREYLWPMHLSGVLLKEKNQWKFAHLHFSMTKPFFPDERLENANDHLVAFKKWGEMARAYSSNQINDEHKSVLKVLETYILSKEETLDDSLFSNQHTSIVFGLDTNWYQGKEEIKEFFKKNSDGIVSFAMENAMASNYGTYTWLTAIGTVKQVISQEELSNIALKEIEKLGESNLSSKEKIFQAHRSIAYVLKEEASGEGFTCPIRLTALLKKEKEKHIVQSLHFSYPFYWIVEGKVDGI